MLVLKLPITQLLIGPDNAAQWTKYMGQKRALVARLPFTIRIMTGFTIGSLLSGAVGRDMCRPGAGVSLIPMTQLGRLTRNPELCRMQREGQSRAVTIIHSAPGWHTRAGVHLHSSL